MTRGRELLAVVAGFWLLVGLLGVLGAADGDRVFLPVVLRPGDGGTPVPPTSTVPGPVTVTPEGTPTATATNTPAFIASPTATNTVVFTATPTATAVATATPQAPAGCSICSYDAYNCSDFSTQRAAQACHDYCMARVGYDVHKLDADGDGEACESLPRLVTVGGWVFVWDR